MNRRIIGHSVERRPIVAYVRGGRADRTVLVLGGMHGDEPKSVDLARRFIEPLENKVPPLRPPLVRGGGDSNRTRWIFVSLVNPDGYSRRKRHNARKVDLNRNFPTRNWTLGPHRSCKFGGTAPDSEPESRQKGLDALWRLYKSS